MMTRRDKIAGLFFALACVLCAPGEAAAQGFTPAEGALWAKLGYGYARATQDFSGVDDRLYADIALGTRNRFRSRQGELVGGTLQIHDTTLDVAWAPVDGFVLGGFVPVLKAVRYENPRPFQTKATGPGDILLYGGAQLTPRSERRIGVTAYAKVKVPTSHRYPYTNEALRGEGQVDVSGALGTSIVLAPGLYLNNTVELRHRFQHHSAEGSADPGDELEASLSLGGGPVDGLWLTAGLNGLWGAPFRVKPAGQDSFETRMERRFYTGLVSAYWSGLGAMMSAPGLALDVWFKVPLAGVDYPVLYSGGVGVAMSL
jgi:hypothetical protein